MLQKSEEGYYIIGKPLFNESYQVLLENESPYDIPGLSIPLKGKDLQIIYTHINTKYFSNALPAKLDKLYFAKLARKVLGRYSLEYNKTKISKHSIMINGNIDTDPKEVIDTMIHEMIHTWQYVNAVKTGDFSYTDITPMQRMFMRSLEDKDSIGHGENFKKWMQFFNSKGFNVTKTADYMVVDTITGGDIYGLIIDTNHKDASIVLFSWDDFKKSIPDIIKQLSDLYGISYMLGYSYFKTNHPAITSAIRVTKSGVLPKNIKNYLFANSFGTGILNHEKTSIIETDGGNPIGVGIESELPPDVEANVKQVLTMMAKYRVDSDYDMYLKNVLYNTDKWKYLYRLKGSVSKKIIEDEVPNSVKDFIKQHWQDVTPIEIKRSKYMKWGVRKLAFNYIVPMLREYFNMPDREESDFINLGGIFMKRPPQRQSDLEEMLNNFNKIYIRTPIKSQFPKLVSESLLSDLKKELKKRGNDISIFSKKFTNAIEHVIEEFFKQNKLKESYKQEGRLTFCIEKTKSGYLKYSGSIFSDKNTLNK